MNAQDIDDLIGYLLRKRHTVVNYAVRLEQGFLVGEYVGGKMELRGDFPVLQILRHELDFTRRPGRRPEHR